MDFLSNQQTLYSSNPTLTTYYANLASLFERRQYHQITDLLEALIQDETCWIDRNLLDLFQQFVSKFETKLNPMRFVVLSLRVSKQHFISNPPTEIQLSSALDFVTNLSQKSFLDDDSRVVAKMGMVELLVQLYIVKSQQQQILEDITNNIEKAKTLLEEVLPHITLIEGEYMTQVKSSYYFAQSTLYKVIGPPLEFYNNATQFLVYTPISSVYPKQKRIEFVEDLCLAALSSEDVFNFGELLQEQELMSYLPPSKKWLKDLLLVFHNGNVDTFNECIDTYRNVIMESQTLQLDIMKQKIALCCLMRLVFERPPHQRDISFDEIALATRLPNSSIEGLLMKAFAKNLVHGTIDEISRVVHITYLLPRTLDTSQLLALDKQLLQWNDKVDEALAFEMTVPELFS
jgi:26S proteasome regulatory subunit N9